MITAEQSSTSTGQREATVPKDSSSTPQSAPQAQLEALVSARPEAVVPSLLALEQEAYEQLTLATDAILIGSLLRYMAVHLLFQNLGMPHLLPARDFSRLQQPMGIEEVPYRHYQDVIVDNLEAVKNWVVAQFETTQSVPSIPNDEFERRLCEAFPAIREKDAHDAALYMANALQLMDRTRSGKSYVPHVETVVEG